MSDKFRCTNAFLYDGRVYPGGHEVDEDDAILDTHRAHFAKVEHRGAPTFEAATAAPGELRTLTAPTRRGPGRPRKDAAKASESAKQQDAKPETKTEAKADAKVEDKKGDGDA